MRGYGRLRLVFFRGFTLSRMLIKDEDAVRLDIEIAGESRAAKKIVNWFVELNSHG